jgi:regulator of protease activity HflC (stomatin/prohibitin superfamily)
MNDSACGSSLTTYILQTFESSTEFNAYLCAQIWPAFKARAKQVESEREQVRQAHFESRQARWEAEHVERQARRQAREAKTKADHAARTARQELKARKEAATTYNKRFVDLDGAPLTTRQVEYRADRGQPVREIATGRLMHYDKQIPRWIEANDQGTAL